MWCRRGVDGFRCDAGYKVPVAAWQYIVARVQQEFPETLFLLEGLGGAWESTEALLTDGGMQWAYSELFQNYSGPQVAGYLDHCLRKSEEVGLLVHYSETHDNERLAHRGRVWALLRNRLCALASVSGGFGFTCGVEWLASEKIKVHGCTGLGWDGHENILSELAHLDRLISNHPCFFDGAKVTRLSAPDSPVLVLRREAPAASMVTGQQLPDEVLVLANLDVEKAYAPNWEPRARPLLDESWVDLLTAESAQLPKGGSHTWSLLAPGAVQCLGRNLHPQGLNGPEYRRLQAIRAWAAQAATAMLPQAMIQRIDVHQLGLLAQRDHVGYLAALVEVSSSHDESDEVSQALAAAMDSPGRSYSAVIRWALPDRNRITPVPPNHWLLIEDKTPFRVTLDASSQGPRSSRCQEAEASLLTVNLESVEICQGLHVACFAPRTVPSDGILSLERYADANSHFDARVRFLPPLESAAGVAQASLRPEDLVLLTNGRGGMARLCVDLGRVNSKYDCVLGANLHPDLPVDRHVLAKRVRVWVNADGFISPLDFRSLASFRAGPPAAWNFVANAGDGRTVEIQVSAVMLENRNTTLLQFSRPTAAQASGKQLPAQADVRLTVRVDIEDRGFHSETRHNGGAEHHFASHTRTLPAAGQNPGFTFTPAADRHLRVYTSSGEYHPSPEWCLGVPHPVERSRGQEGSGDAYSPGWFELPLPKGAAVHLVVTADPENPSKVEIETASSWFHRVRPGGAWSRPVPFSQSDRRRKLALRPMGSGCASLRCETWSRQDSNRGLSLVPGLGPGHLHCGARPFGRRHA